MCVVSVYVGGFDVYGKLGFVCLLLLLLFVVSVYGVGRRRVFGAMIF